MIEAELDLIITKAGLGHKGSYRPDEVARILGIHKTTVYALMDRRALACFVVADTRRVTYSAILDYLNQNTVGTSSYS